MIKKANRKRHVPKTVQIFPKNARCPVGMTDELTNYQPRWCTMTTSIPIVCMCIKQCKLQSCKFDNLPTTLYYVAFFKTGLS